jgi:dihydrofolate reductase
VSKLVVTEYMSLDGVMDEPGEWSMPFFSDEAAKFKFDELFASDAMLLGRKTYDGFAAAWPKMTDEAGFADRMNTMPKYVVSSTLRDPEWAGSVVVSGDDLVAEVGRLKQEEGGDLLVAGSVQLVRALMEHDLVDELRLMVHPIVLGGGRLVFGDGMPKRTLRLADTRTFSSGVVVLTYHPAA